MVAASGSPFENSERFPPARHSAIRALTSTDAAERKRALDLIVGVYWKPAYKYARVKYRLTPDDASDLVQGFFTTIVEKDSLATYDQSKARFRTFFRLCLDRFTANENRREAAQKRGGDWVANERDILEAEQELQVAVVSVPPDIESWFDREWTRQLFTLAVERMRDQCDAEGKTLPFRLFEAYDLQEERSGQISYEALAISHNLKVTDVTNHLAAMRRQFRSIVLHLIRDLTASDEEYRDEVRTVLGVKLL